MKDGLSEARRLRKSAKPLLDRLMDELEGENPASALADLIVVTAIVFRKLRGLPVNDDQTESDGHKIIDFLGTLK